MTTPAEAEASIAGLIPKRGTAALVRGRGCEVWDDADRRYLDLTSGHGIAPLGHCHPELVEAVSNQAGRLIACSASFHNDCRGRFALALEKVLPDRFGHTFLCSTGTEAIEAGIKFAYLRSGRPDVVALRQGFHGRTLGALATTWNPRFRKPFDEIVRPTTFVTPGDVDALDEAIGETVGLFVAEPIQGESGVLPVDRDFLLAAQRLCHDRGALFMVDEIQTGVGRTGAWWAHESLGLEPDMMALAKGIAGGFPMGALVSTPDVAAALKPGLHGSTFGGNPLACAAGAATLEILGRDDLPRRAAVQGERLLTALSENLEDVPLVKSIRGRGLMIGIELRQRVAPYLRRLMEEAGILALPAGPTVLRLLPPLVLTEAEADEGVAAVCSVLEAP